MVYSMPSSVLGTTCILTHLIFNILHKFFYFYLFFVFFFCKFIYFSWRLITLQYCGGFLPYIHMNQPWVYMSSPSWPTLPVPSLMVIPVHQPWAPVSFIKPGLAICFTYDNIHVSMLFSQIISPLPSPTESKWLFYTSVSLFLSRI